VHAIENVCANQHGNADNEASQKRTAHTLLPLHSLSPLHPLAVHFLRCRSPAEGPSMEFQEFKKVKDRVVGCCTRDNELQVVEWIRETQRVHGGKVAIRHKRMQ